MSTVPEQSLLIANLFKLLQQRHGVAQAALLETHISAVLLTGQIAYKIKKAVKLDFLDFSTLERRRDFCREELRLNRRFAPRLYLDVVRITGSPEVPLIEGSGAAIEYAVKMRQFPQEYLGDALLARGALRAEHIDALATALVAFHQGGEAAGAGSGFGSPAGIAKRARDAVSQIRHLLGDAANRPEHAEIDSIEEWIGREFAERATAFEQRLRHGFVRECHGDLHLGNIAVIDGEITLFDCIEFSEDLRTIDVMNEVAFLAMDFHAHARLDFAFRFLNAYLEKTGDYAGLALLRFYVVYRAMVRAEIALLRHSRSAGNSRAGLLEQFHRYLNLAIGWTRPPHPALVLMHGLSGSGKSVASQQLLQMLGAIRLRSDVERKRMAGVKAGASSGSGLDAGLYATAATEATYLRLLDLAQKVMAAGFTVIVDAAFLLLGQRRLFREWAVARGLPFAILSLCAPQDVLRERIANRAREGQDASEANLAVFERQVERQQELSPDELPFAVLGDSTRLLGDAPDSVAAFAALVSDIASRLRAAGFERH